MKVIIIEDESIASRRLKKILLDIDSSIQVIEALESVNDAIRFFKSNQGILIDLCFSDIQLSDGLAFEIFEEIDSTFPIIFTTAYDEYALKAFKLNGVDYLLKPIQKEELAKAIHKYRKIRDNISKEQLFDVQKLMGEFQNVINYSPSFICYKKDKIIPVSADKIAFFYINNQIVYAVADNTQYVLNDSMEEIEKRLPAHQFFRANRQFIIQKKYVQNAVQYFNNRLLVNLTVKIPENIIISREKSVVFKKWLSGG